MGQKFTQIKFLEFDFWTGDGKLQSVSIDLGEDERASGCQFSFYDPKLQIASYLFQLSQASGGITTPFDLLESGTQPGTAPTIPVPGTPQQPGLPGTPVNPSDPVPGRGVPGRDLTPDEIRRFCELGIVSIFGVNAENRPAGGSGFIVDPDGTMVTNNHVYEACRGVDVDINFRDRSKGKLQWLHWDKGLDLAIGRITRTGTTIFPVVQVSRTFDLSQNQEVIGIGLSDAIDRNANPPVFVPEKGWDMLTGRVSRLSVGNVLENNSNPGKFFEVTASNFADKGDSGSPALNRRGLVVGVVHAAISGTATTQERAYSIRVDALREWYRSKMGKPIPDPVIGTTNTTPAPGIPGLPPTQPTPTPTPSPAPTPPPSAPLPSNSVPTPPPPAANPPGTSGKTSTGIWLSDAKEGLRNDDLARKIIQYCRAVGVNSINHQACILANVQHETVMGVYTSEIGGPSKRYAPWYGRGLIQLTWENNYKNAGEKLGVDFVSGQNRELVKQLRYAIPIAVLGMRDGWFTGRKLSDYGQ